MLNQWIGGKEFQHLSPITIRGIVRALQLALGKRFERGSVHYPSRVSEENETRCFTSAEVAAIITSAPGQYKALFTLAAETGMRAGEVYGLRVEDIDFNWHVIHVRRSMWNTQAQTPKTSSAIAPSMFNHT